MSEVRFRGKKKKENSQDQEAKSPEKNEEINLDLRKSFWLTRIIFLRGLSFIYFVAFAISYNQNKELIGDDGLLPAKLYLGQIKEHFKGFSNPQLFLQVPTLYWFLDSWDNLNHYLDMTALTGMSISAFVFIKGSANSLLIFTLWILYTSIVNIGQRWFSFGWESQILETGFLAIWIVPFVSLDQFKYKPNFLAIYGYRFFITRIMLGAGLIKIRGDKCWTELTCMNYFYETQPNPNPAAYFAHKAPEAWHMFETFGNHVIELIFPFFTFIPFRWASLLNGFFQMLFQIILISTGNLSFLNWLTVLPSIWFFDDKIWIGLFNDKIGITQKIKKAEKSRADFFKHIRTLTSVIIGVMLAYLSIPIIQNLMSSKQIMNTSFEPFRIVNTYGAFGSVTKERTEVIFEGTHSNSPEDSSAKWLEYDFKCKPGNVSQMPCLISPYHYRLDWLMWFAAFQDYQHNPWMVHLTAKMLKNDPIVDSLLMKNPFKGKKPPKYVRARHYKYNFSRWSSSNWWSRKYVKEYMPIMSLLDVEPICKQFGWKC